MDRGWAEAAHQRKIQVVYRSFESSMSFLSVTSSVFRLDLILRALQPRESSIAVSPRGREDGHDPGEAPDPRAMGESTARRSSAYHIRRPPIPEMHVLRQERCHLMRVLLRLPAVCSISESAFAFASLAGRPSSRLAAHAGHRSRVGLTGTWDILRLFNLPNFCEGMIIRPRNTRNCLNLSKRRQVSAYGKKCLPPPPLNTRLNRPQIAAD